MVKAAAIVLIGCLLLSGCTKQTLVADNATEPDLQASTSPHENTMPDDVFVDEIPEDSVAGTASSEPPHATEANTGSNDVPNTSPTESTVATNPENQEPTTPDYGIELPEHDWD